MSIDGGKNVHPFFSKAAARPASDAPGDENQYQDTIEYDVADHRADIDEKPKRTRSKRKPKNEKPKNQPTLVDIVNPKSEASVSDAVVERDVSEVGQQDGPRKRRRISQFDVADGGSENVDANNGLIVEAVDIVAAAEHSPRVIIPRSSPLPRIQPPEVDLDGSDANQAVAKPLDQNLLEPNIDGRSSSSPLGNPRELELPPLPLPQVDNGLINTSHVGSTEMTHPQKILKLNANGRFSSPPSRTLKSEAESKSQPSTGRLRPRKPAAKTVSLVVSIGYGGGNDSSRVLLGEKIDSIFAGNLTVPTMKPPPKKCTFPKPRKPTHPFFSGKPERSPPNPKPESPRKTSAVTPGKLRVKAFSERLPLDTKEVEFTSALLKDRHMMKHPGATEAPFPNKGQVHVRGDAFKIKQPMCGPTFDRLFARRKHKQAILPLAQQESVIVRFKSRLIAAEDPPLRSDGFYEPSSSLYIPERLLLSGQEIAERVSEELSVSIAARERDELSLPTGSCVKSSPYPQRSSQELQNPHTALLRLYDRIPHMLTAFDECRGEALGWTQKYAPCASTEVLQPENEVVVLKDWLKSLQVQAVDAADPESKMAQLKVAEKPKKKRKKKADDMNDFLVDSDEDVREMNEISAAEVAVDSGSLKTKGSIVQSLSDNLKLSNTVLLSGPHGCGKTAAAYAVAKELGFKVFEISSSERRSGRDVLEKVGDMTENHMVRHHGARTVEMPAPEADRNDEAFQRDLESGRQGTMSAFFKPKPSKHVSTEPKKLVKEKKIRAVQEAIKKPAKDQQQSLILLEEVDILFRDDKDFWITVIKLITTSKRPFIMTCNDETIVPLQAIGLHAILRFKEPPPDLAADFLLLMAAAEGHLLNREAVSTLYQSHQYDLRASITELDYWCRMGVGDPRGGLSWIYQRYPPGSDLDEQGRKLRIVSANTYQSTMGRSSTLELDAHAALARAWNELGVTPATALGWDIMSLDVQEEPVSDSSCRKLLSQFSRYADAFSAADACTARGLADTAPFDHSQPELTDKARANHIIGQELLPTNEGIDYMELSKDVLISMAITASQIYDQTLDSEKIVSRSLSNSSRIQTGDDMLTRQAFACFDPIATSSELSLNNHPGLMQSVFDGTLKVVALDLAPYVRSIVQYDRILEEQRARLNLLASDGRSSKRQRTTRAARSALEGGPRATTRKERWFANELDVEAVLATGGKEWPRFSYSSPSTGSISKDGTEATAPASSAGSA